MKFQTQTKIVIVLLFIYILFLLLFPADSQFPIDISSVKKDHDFLDKDLVEPLCR